MVGLPHKAKDRFDFISCMDQCGMIDAGFLTQNSLDTIIGDLKKRVYKRRDMIIFNDVWT